MLYVSLSVSVKSWKFSFFAVNFSCFSLFHFRSSMLLRPLCLPAIWQKKWKFNSFITFDRQLLASEIHKKINTQKNRSKNHFRHRNCFFSFFYFIICWIMFVMETLFIYQIFFMFPFNWINSFYSPFLVC